MSALRFGDRERDTQIRRTYIGNIEIIERTKSLTDKPTKKTTKI